MSRIDYARAFSSPGIRRKKESRTPKRPGTTAGNPRATSHERLTGQERRRRSSAYTGAGGGDGLAGKRKARAWYPSRQCIATAPLPGAPFACQVGAISLWPAAAPVRTGDAGLPGPYLHLYQRTGQDPALAPDGDSAEVMADTRYR
jgi:hypothetical protein